MLNLIQKLQQNITKNTCKCNERKLNLRESKKYLCMSNIKFQPIHLTGNSLQKHALSLPEISPILN